jgi:hypothetical protein
MALRKFVERITKSTEDLDRERLQDFCSARDASPIGSVVPRRTAKVAGEIRSVRIVPRAGAAAVEATINDGGHSLVAVFLGRRRVGGITTGRRIVVEGMVGHHDSRPMIFNPIYQLF